MVSCWEITFKNGHKIIISEELYQEEEARNWAGKERSCEAHWFDFEACKKANPGVMLAGVFEPNQSKAAVQYRIMVDGLYDSTTAKMNLNQIQADIILRMAELVNRNSYPDSPQIRIYKDDDRISWNK